MIHMTTSIPPDAGRDTIPIVRVSGTASKLCIATSETYWGCWSHWYNGRTRPCTDPACEPCQNGSPRRWHSYTAIYSPGNHSQHILELTAQATEHLANYRLAHGTLRGAAITVRRATQKPNSRIILECHPADQRSITLPRGLDLVRALATLWGIDPKDFCNQDHAADSAALLEALLPKLHLPTRNGDLTELHHPSSNPAE
jgi:hypothetical protein